MQQPWQERKRRRREEKVAWRVSLGRDEVVRSVAQEVLDEGMVAGFDWWRKKKKVCRGERNAGRRNEREPWWLLGGRLVRSSGNRWYWRRWWNDGGRNGGDRRHSGEKRGGKREKLQSEFIYFQNKRYRKDISNDNIYYFLFLKDYCKKLSIPKLFNKDM